MNASHQDLEREVDALIRIVLRIEPEENVLLRRSEVAEWDSLRHVEIVFALEDQYGVQFDESEFAQLDSTVTIAALLRLRLET